MAELHLPPILPPLFPGLPRELEVEAATVDEAIDRSNDRWPGMRDRLVEPGPKLRPHINVYVDRERGGLDTELEPASRIDVIAAISGGSTATGAPPVAAHGSAGQPPDCGQGHSAASPRRPSSRASGPGRASRICSPFALRAPILPLSSCSTISGAILVESISTRIGESVRLLTWWAPSLPRESRRRRPPSAPARLRACGVWALRARRRATPRLRDACGTGRADCQARARTSLPRSTPPRCARPPKRPCFASPCAPRLRSHSSPLQVEDLHAEIVSARPIKPDVGILDQHPAGCEAGYLRQRLATRPLRVRPRIDIFEPQRNGRVFRLL